MATARPCLAQLSRLALRPNLSIPANTSTRLLSTTASRAAGLKKTPKGTAPNSKYKKKGAELKKKKARTVYKEYPVADLETFTLCDAMRYIKAFEVGYRPATVKYELAVKFKSLKNGPVIRNRLRLPHPVKTDVRICVICPPDSKYAEAARAAGASLVGQEDIFESIKDGRIDFDRCICQTDSLEKMNKAGLGRVLGPRGLMPSTKMGTVVKDPASVLKDMIGGAEYRERLGTVRMAIGQLGFAPEEMQKNIRTFIEHIKKDVAHLSDKINKEMSEVVLSSTNSPGFPLSGEFQDSNSKITPRELSAG